MDVISVERQKMGRPKRVIATTSVKIEEDAYELVRKAATFLDVSVVEYVSRILREQARKDLTEGAERFLREQKDVQEVKKPSKKKADRKAGEK